MLVLQGDILAHIPSSVMIGPRSVESFPNPQLLEGMAWPDQTQVMGELSLRTAELPLQVHGVCVDVMVMRGGARRLWCSHLMHPPCCPGHPYQGVLRPLELPQAVPRHATRVLRHPNLLVKGRGIGAGTRL